MTITFSCAGCGDGFSVPDSMAGSRASCNKCGAVLQVPATGAQMAASLSPVASPGQGAARQTAGDQTNPLIDPSYRGAAEPTSSASAGATWMYGSLGAVASMLGLMVLIIFLTGGSSRSRVITGGPRANSAANVPETKTPATASTAGASGAPSGSAGSSGEDVAKPTAVESATDSSTRVDPPTPTGSAQRRQLVCGDWGRLEC